MLATSVFLSRVHAQVASFSNHVLAIDTSGQAYCEAPLPSCLLFGQRGLTLVLLSLFFVVSQRGVRARRAVSATTATCPRRCASALFCRSRVLCPIVMTKRSTLVLVFMTRSPKAITKGSLEGRSVVQVACGLTFSVVLTSDGAHATLLLAARALPGRSC